MSDLEGLKIRTTDGSSSDAIETLGGVAVPSSGIGAYQLVSRGIVDGLIMPTGDMRTFNMLQYTDHAVTIPGKIYNGSFSLFMNLVTWNSLSRTDQQAILSISGETFAHHARAWDESDRLAIEEMGRRGIARSIASDPFLDELRTRLAFIDNTWIREADRRGVNGRAALDYFRTEARRIAASLETLE